MSWVILTFAFMSLISNWDMKIKSESTVLAFTMGILQMTTPLVLTAIAAWVYLS